MQVFDPIKRILQTALVISLRSNTLRNQLLGDQEPINKIHNGLPQRSAFGSKTCNRFVTLLQIGPYAYPGQKHKYYRINSNQNDESVYAPDSKIHVANMGPTWVLSAPGGPRVGPMNLAVRGGLFTSFVTFRFSTRTKPQCVPFSHFCSTWACLTDILRPQVCLNIVNIPKLWTLQWNHCHREVYVVSLTSPPSSNELDTWRPRRNRRQLADDCIIYIFLNENVFRFKFHWSLFQRVRLTIFPHWFNVKCLAMNNCAFDFDYGWWVHYVNVIISLNCKI